MKRLTRASAVLLAAGLAVPLWAVPASAESATEAPSSAAYFNRAGIPQPDGVPQKPPNLPASADGVAPGNLAVAAQAGAEDKVSFLYFSLSTLPVGAVISKATLTVPLVPTDNANVTVNADPAQVVACKITGSGFSSEDGEALSLAPPRDCPAFNAAATKEGEAYVFDITSLAATWVDLNDGLALTRKEGGNANFQVVFSREASLTYEFTPPVETTTETTTTDTTTTDVTTTAPVDTGSTVGTGTTDLGFSGAVDTGSAESGGFGSAGSPLLPSALPPAAPAPVTADDGDAVVAAPVSASGGPVGDSTPTAGFWLAGLLLAGTLALLSLIMGDPRSAAPAASAPSRLSQALSSARRSGTSAFTRPA